MIAPCLNAFALSGRVNIICCGITQGAASLALGYVLHWAFSPPLLNQLSNVQKIAQVIFKTLLNVKLTSCKGSVSSVKDKENEEQTTNLSLPYPTLTSFFHFPILCTSRRTFLLISTMR